MFGILPSGLEWRKVPEYRVCGKSPLGGMGRANYTSSFFIQREYYFLTGAAKNRSLFRETPKSIS